MEIIKTGGEFQGMMGKTGAAQEHKTRPDQGD
jgi:hypothetical protein